NVDDHAAHELLALLTGDQQDFENRSVVNAGDAFDGVDGATFHQELENFFRPSDFGVHAAERVRVRLRVRALARFAVEARESVAVFAELPALRLTGGTRHSGQH